MEASGEATVLLRRLGEGDSTAAEELLSLLYGELHRIARRHMEGERRDHTLQPTALVNEAFLRLVGGAAVEWEDRAHFLNTAARAMRNVLVDHARARAANKRGGERRREPLDEALALYESRGIDLIPLDGALGRLHSFDPELGRMVELRFFTGLSNGEVARVLGTSLRSVERGWFTARAWLRTELGGVDVGEG